MSVGLDLCGMCRGSSSANSLVPVSGPDHPDRHFFHAECVSPRIAAQLQAHQIPVCPLCNRKVTFLNNVEISPPEAPQDIDGENQADEEEGYGSILGAAMDHNVEAVQAYLAGEDNDEDDLEKTLYYAATCNLEAMVIALLNSEQIPHKYYGHALRGASEKGNETVVSLLLVEGPSLTDRIKAASIALQNGHRGVARIIIGSCSEGLIKAATVGLIGIAWAIYYQLSKEQSNRIYSISHQ